ncbi:MAG: radical SAM protein [Anaerolineales bacterium]|nr:radical SAM protein [Anaerolineales bacterium]
MATEITVKTILNHVKQPDPWFGLKYNMNLYRGCQHQCIYCDSRSTCYRLGNLADIRVKVNALELLADALPRKRVVGTIGFGSMNDPYMPVEKEYRLTRGALEIIQQQQFPVHIMTKSDLVLRDLDLLENINSIYGAVSFTITTADDELAKKLEPGAPLPSIRFRAMRILARSGILTGVTMMPILPFLEDDPDNIRQIVRKTRDQGGTYIIPAFGMTLRPGSRDFYYQKLDKHFPGLKEKYIKAFGENYQCSVPNWRQLNGIFQEEINQAGIVSKIPVFEPQIAKGKSNQMSFFGD